MINEMVPILMQDSDDLILEKKQHAFIEREKMKKKGSKNQVVVSIVMANILAMKNPLLN